MKPPICAKAHSASRCQLGEVHLTKIINIYDEQPSQSMNNIQENEILTRNETNSNANAKFDYHEKELG